MSLRASSPRKSRLITGRRSGAEKRHSSREVQRSTFARFLGLFDFRLLQQYLPRTDIRRHSGVNCCRCLIRPSNSTAQLPDDFFHRQTDRQDLAVGVLRSGDHHADWCGARYMARHRQGAADERSSMLSVASSRPDPLCARAGSIRQSAALVSAKAPRRAESCKKSRRS